MEELLDGIWNAVFGPLFSQTSDWFDIAMGLMFGALILAFIAFLCYCVLLFFDWILATDKKTGTATCISKHKYKSFTTVNKHTVGENTFFTTTQHPARFSVMVQIEDQQVEEFFNKDFWKALNVGDTLSVTYWRGRFRFLNKIYTDKYAWPTGPQDTATQTS